MFPTKDYPTLFKPKLINAMNENPIQKLIHCTVRIECEDINGNGSCGTGYIVNMCEDKESKKVTPCIVTNVGDCSSIIGKTGWLVPPQNPARLAKIIESVFNQIGSKDWNKRRNESRLRRMPRMKWLERLS